MVPDFIKEFTKRQFEIWEPAAKNYQSLEEISEREQGGFPYMVKLQHNPARAISTNADTSKEALEKRKCFLCKENRPKEQLILNLLPGFDILVNPYPIFPYHLTIASQTHRPQESIGEEMAHLAHELRGMVIFFNGAKAGASAPDHFHYQAVAKEYLPLVNFVEKRLDFKAKGIDSGEFNKDDLYERIFIDSKEDKELKDLPFRIFTGVLGKSDDISQSILTKIKKLGGGDKLTDKGLVNIFLWEDENSLIRFIHIPRKKHRPDCFYYPDEKKIMISPGCIDMGGVIVVPLKKNFEELTFKTIQDIYKETAF